THNYYDVHLQQWMSPVEHVNNGLQLNEQLSNTYDVMQEINHALRQRDHQRLAACLNQTHHVGPQMQGVLR
ncbi:hypothetical protein, partial [Ligilactobacillus hohenheimensis]